MKNIIIIGVLVVVALFMLSLASGSVSSIGSSNGPVATPDSTNSGTINYGLVTSLVQSSFNPYSPVGSYYFYSMLYLPFASYNFPPSPYLRPILAQSWSSSNNNTVWNLTLKPNLKWDNGSPLNSTDLQFTLALANQTGALYGFNVTSIKIINSTTVQVTMSRPEPNFVALWVTYTNSYILPAQVFEKFDPYYKTNISYQEYILSKMYKALENFTNFNNIVADGPFVLSNYTPGANPLIFHANKYYYMGPPKMTTLSVRIFSSVASMSAAMRSGEIDAMWDMGSYNTVVAPNFMGIPNTKDYYIEPGPYMSVDFNMWEWPYNTTQFRMALAYMTNRSSINSIVNMNNSSDLVGYNMLTDVFDNYLGINPNTTNNYPYNLSKANGLLKEIGIVKDNVSSSPNYGLYIYNNPHLPDYGNPVVINITTTQLGFGDLSTAIELEDQWSPLGFKVSITTLATNSFYTLIGDKTGWDVAVQIDPIGYYPNALANVFGILSYDNSTLHNFNTSFGMMNYNASMITHLENESFMYPINTPSSNKYVIEGSELVDEMVPTIPLWINYNWEAVSTNYYWGNQTNHTGLFDTQALVQPQFWYGCLWAVHPISSSTTSSISPLLPYTVIGVVVAVVVILGAYLAVLSKRKKQRMKGE